MDTENYQKKIRDLQKYIPFLENLIKKLQNTNGGNPREAQLSKMLTLYQLLTNKEKKLKLDTLDKISTVLKNLHLKMEKNVKIEHTDDDDDTKKNNNRKIEHNNFSTDKNKQTHEISKVNKSTVISNKSCLATKTGFERDINNKQEPVYFNHNIHKNSTKSDPLIIPTERFCKQKSQIDSQKMFVNHEVRYRDTIQQNDYEKLCHRRSKSPNFLKDLINTSQMTMTSEKTLNNNTRPTSHSIIGKEMSSNADPRQQLKQTAVNQTDVSNLVKPTTSYEEKRKDTDKKNLIEEILKKPPLSENNIVALLNESSLSEEKITIDTSNISSVATRKDKNQIVNEFDQEKNKNYERHIRLAYKYNPHPRNKSDSLDNLEKSENPMKIPSLTELIDKKTTNINDSKKYSDRSSDFQYKKYGVKESTKFQNYRKDRSHQIEREKYETSKKLKDLSSVDSKVSSSKLKELNMFKSSVINTVSSPLPIIGSGNKEAVQKFKIPKKNKNEAGSDDIKINNTLSTWKNIETKVKNDVSLTKDVGQINVKNKSNFDKVLDKQHKSDKRTEIVSTNKKVDSVLHKEKSFSIFNKLSENTCIQVIRKKDKIEDNSWKNLNNGKNMKKLESEGKNNEIIKNYNSKNINLDEKKPNSEIATVQDLKKDTKNKMKTNDNKKNQMEHEVKGNNDFPEEFVKSKNDVKYLKEPINKLKLVPKVILSKNNNLLSSSNLYNDSSKNIKSTVSTQGIEIVADENLTVISSKMMQCEEGIDNQNTASTLANEFKTNKSLDDITSKTIQIKENSIDNKGIMSIQGIKIESDSSREVVCSTIDTEGKDNSKDINIASIEIKETKLDQISEVTSSEMSKIKENIKDIKEESFTQNSEKNSETKEVNEILKDANMDSNIKTTEISSTTSLNLPISTNEDKTVHAEKNVQSDVDNTKIDTQIKERISTILQNLLNPKATDTEHIMNMLKNILDSKKFEQIKEIVYSPDDVQTKTDIKENVNLITNTQEKEEEEEEEEDEISVVTADSNMKTVKIGGDTKRKKKKNELQKLNEDICNMFICEGVVTATGKRMCTMLNENKNQQQLSEEQPKQIVKKVRKKVKTNFSNAKKKLKNKELSKKKDLDKETTHNTESDNDHNSDVDMEKTVSEYINKKCLTESESESITEETVPESSNQKDISVSENKIKTTRKRKKNWQMGVIQKNVKKKKTEIPIVPIKNTSSIKNLNPDFFFGSELAKKCAVCSYKKPYMAAHYTNQHPNTEIFTSRPNPETAKVLKENSSSHLRQVSELTNGRIILKCIICEKIKQLTRGKWIEHILLHTGEHSLMCSKCFYRSGKQLVMDAHAVACNSVIMTLESPKFVNNKLNGYMCSACNFLQLIKSNIRKHIESQHENNDIQIIKINLISLSDDKITEKVLSKNEDSSLASSKENEISEQELVKTESTIKLPENEKLKNNSIADFMDDIDSYKKPKNDLFIDILQKKINGSQSSEQNSDNILNSAKCNETNAFCTVIPGKLIEQENKILQENSQNISILFESKNTSETLNLTESQEITNDKVKKNDIMVIDDDNEWEDLDDPVSESDQSESDNDVLDSPTKILNTNGLQNVQLKSLIANVQSRILNKKKPDELKIEDTTDSEVKGNSINCDKHLSNSVSTAEIIKHELKTETIKINDTNLNKELCNLTSHNDTDCDTSITSTAVIKNEELPISSNNSKVYLEKENIVQIDNKNNDNNVSNKKNNITIKESNICIKNFQKNIKIISVKIQTIDKLGFSKDNEKLFFYCLISKCGFKTDTNSLYINHVSTEHLDHRWEGFCNICNKQIQELKYGPLLNEYKHFMEIHDIIPTDIPHSVPVLPTEVQGSIGNKTIMIKVRRLSGDLLSTNKPISNEITSVSVNINNNILNNNELNTTLTNSLETLDATNIEITETLDKDNSLPNLTNSSPYPIQIRSVHTLIDPFFENLSNAANLKADTIAHSVLKPWIETNCLKTQKMCMVLLRENSLNSFYKCMGICTFTTNESELMLRHLLEHERNIMEMAKNNGNLIGDASSWLECCYCDKDADNCKELISHIDMEHKCLTFQCPYCFYRAHDAPNVLFHLDTYHKLNEKKIYSHLCKSIDTTKYTHLKDDRVKIIICDIDNCDLKFQRVDDYLSHISVKHNKTTIICNFCNNIILCENVLRHLLIHGIGQLQCLYCNFATNESNALKSHISDKHYDKPCLIIIRTHSKLIRETFKYVSHSLDSMLVKLIDDQTPIIPCVLPEKSKYTDKQTTKQTNNQKESIVSLDSEKLSNSPKIELVKVSDEKDKGITYRIHFPNNNSENDKTLLQCNSNSSATNVENFVIELADKNINAKEQQTINNDNTFITILEIVEAVNALSEWSLVNEKQLYRCGFINCCQLTPDINCFTLHMLTHQKSGMYQCFHCKLDVPDITKLKSHLNCHKEKHNYFCAMCSFTGTDSNITTHVIKEHNNIGDIMYMPFDKNSSVYYVSTKEIEASVAKKQEFYKRIIMKYKTLLNLKTIFHPNERFYLPQRSIFVNLLECSICRYATKVRKNLLRHLEQHANNQETVSKVDPVNPVPCLESDKRHFDNMVNLACSSNEVGSKKKLSADYDKLIPKYIPVNKRFICGSESCKYQTINETMIRQHITTLHGNEKVFNCAHCEIDIANGELIPNKIIEHFRHHEEILYKCYKCQFYHYNKSTMEKHCKECHPGNDIKSTFYIYRNIDNKSLKTCNVLYNCQLCSFETIIKKNMYFHICKAHNKETQYECKLCSYTSDNIKKIRSHHLMKHKKEEQQFAVIFKKSLNHNRNPSIIKINELNNINEKRDTTPLWRRNSNKIKHIRGIELETEEYNLVDDGYKEIEENITLLDNDEKTASTNIDCISEKRLSEMSDTKVTKKKQKISLPPFTVQKTYSRGAKLFCVYCPHKDFSLITLRAHYNKNHANKLMPAVNGNKNKCVKPDSNMAKSIVPLSREISSHNLYEYINYVCAYCSKKSFSLDVIAEHWAAHHRTAKANTKFLTCGRPFSFRICKLVLCAYCTKKMLYSEVKVHISRAHKNDNETPFLTLDPFNNRQCGECNFVYKYDVSEMIEHYSELHNDNRTINNLPTNYLTDNFLNALLEVKTPHPNYKCTFCDKICDHKDTLIEHHNKFHIGQTIVFKELTTDDIRYICQMCKYITYCEQDIVKHIRDHKVLYGCNYCDAIHRFIKLAEEHNILNHNIHDSSFKFIDLSEQIYNSIKFLFCNGFVCSKRDLKLTRYGSIDKIKSYLAEINKIEYENIKNSTALAKIPLKRKRRSKSVYQSILLEDDASVLPTVVGNIPGQVDLSNTNNAKIPICSMRLESENAHNDVEITLADKYEKEEIPPKRIKIMQRRKSCMPTLNYMTESKQVVDTDSLWSYSSKIKPPSPPPHNNESSDTNDEVNKNMIDRKWVKIGNETISIPLHQYTDDLFDMKVKLIDFRKSNMHQDLV